MKKEENIYSVRAQEIQDEIFRKMTAGQKIKLVSKFYRFAQNLRKISDCIMSDFVYKEIKL